MGVVPVERFGSRYDLPKVLPGLTKVSKHGEVQEREWSRWQVGEVLLQSADGGSNVFVSWHVPNLDGPGAVVVDQTVPRAGLRDVPDNYPLPEVWQPGLSVEHLDGWSGTIDSVDWSKTNGPISVKPWMPRTAIRGWSPEKLRLIELPGDNNPEIGMPSPDPAADPETAIEEIAAGVQPARASDPEIAETARAERRMGAALHEPVAEPAPAEPEREQIHLIPIGQIGHFPGGNQRTSFDPQKLDELAESIRSVGLLNPLVVNELDGRYTLIAGERRMRAAAMADRTHVECRILHLSHEQALEAMLVENLQREDLNSMDEARAYKRLLELPGASQVSVAKRVGKSQQHVNEYLQLLELSPEMQQNVATGVMSARLAVIYLRQTKEQTPEVQAKVAQTLTEERPSSRQAPEVIRQAVEKLTGKPAVPTRKTAPAPQPEPDPAPAPEPPPQPAPTARAVATTPHPTAPAAPEKPTVMFVPIQTLSLDQVSVQQSQGLGSWPERPTGYDTVFDIEMGLTIPGILASWQQRMAVVDGYLPRGFGTVEIHIPSQSVWIRGRETQAVKQASQYQPDELALVVNDDGVIVQCVGGRVVDTYDGRPAYYRAALYSGPSKLFRQQVVIGGVLRNIVITGSDTVPLSQDQVQRLTEFLLGLGGSKGDTTDEG